MLGALIIVFREVLEAGLIIGIVMAATRGVPHRGRAISIGIGIGFAGACLLAAGAGFVGKLFEGSGQELLNAAILFAAALMLAWHNIWMSTHGREMARTSRDLGLEVAAGHKKLGALMFVVAMAVLREGSEVVLFLYGLLTSQEESLRSVLGGGSLGLLLGALSSVVLYLGLVAVPVRHFFTVTTWLITFLAAGLASQGMLFLQQAGTVDRWSTPIWNTSWLLPESGWVGRALHTLVGYSDQPSGMQLIAYLVTLVGIMVLMRAQRRADSHA